jgi:hypothetical protein
MRVVLIAAVAFLGAYMMFLRPKSDSGTTPPPAATPAGNVNTGKPAVTGFGKAVEAAKGAAAATEAKQNAEAVAEGEAPAGTASGTHSAATAAQSGKAAEKASGAADMSGIPLPVSKAIAHHKILALLFTNRRSADDRAVGAALKKIDRLDGGVYVQSAPMKALARYSRITRGADVQQSPTLVVVDRKLRATNLVGYADRLAIQQAVADAARASGGLLTDPYLKRVNHTCSSLIHDWNTVPEATTVPQARHTVQRLSTRFDRLAHDLRAIPAPHRWAAFKRASVSDVNAMTTATHAYAHRLSGSDDLPQLVGATQDFLGAGGPASKRFNARADKHHLLYCGSLG